MADENLALRDSTLSSKTRRGGKISTRNYLSRNNFQHQLFCVVKMKADAVKHNESCETFSIQDS